MENIEIIRTKKKNPSNSPHSPHSLHSPHSPHSPTFNLFFININITFDTEINEIIEFINFIKSRSSMTLFPLTIIIININNNKNIVEELMNLIGKELYPQKLLIKKSVNISCDSTALIIYNLSYNIKVIDEYVLYNNIKIYLKNSSTSTSTSEMETKLLKKDSKYVLTSETFQTFQILLNDKYDFSNNSVIEYIIKK